MHSSLILNVRRLNHGYDLNCSDFIKGLVSSEIILIPNSILKIDNTHILNKRLLGT